MIDRKTAIKELNEKICFVSEKYVDSDIPVKDAIADENRDFMATEGEIIALLKTEPASDICREIKILRRHLDHDKLCELNTSGTLSANLEGKLQMLDEIQKVIDEICDNPPEEIPRYKIAEAEKMLTVNGVDKDEAENVLQMLGQILFNTELYSAEEETALITIEPVSEESKTETPCSYIITQFELPAYGIIETDALPDDFKRIASSKILSKSNDPVTEIKDMLTQQGYQVKVRPHKIYNVSESDFASKYNNGIK